MPYDNIPFGAMLFGETFVKPPNDDTFRPCGNLGSHGVSFSSETTPSSSGFSDEYTLEGDSSHFDVDDLLIEPRSEQGTNGNLMMFPHCRVEIQTSADRGGETTQVKIRPVPEPVPKTEPRQIVNFLRKMYGSPEILDSNHLYNVMVIPFHRGEPYLGVAAADEDGYPYPVYDYAEGVARYPSPSEVVVLGKFGTNSESDPE